MGAAAPGSREREACERRAAGDETLTAIANDLGVSIQTIYRWTDPEYAENQRRLSREAKARRKSELAEYDREYYLSHRKKCDCGRLMARHSLVCEHCISGEKVAKREQMVALWNQGLNAPQIAERVGTTAKTVQCEIARMRREGIDVPYRRPYQRDWRCVLGETGVDR